MSSDPVAELAARALALPPDDRARLAEELLASLDPGDQEADAAWDQELLRRIEQVDSGSVRLVPLDEAMARVRRVIGP